LRTTRARRFDDKFGVDIDKATRSLY